MAFLISAILGTLIASYTFFRFLLSSTQDDREPPAILTGIPFMTPLLGMIKEKSQFHIRLRDTYKLPIYTLRLPFSRLYIVNDANLIPVIQKQWRYVSFNALAADGGRMVGMSKESIEIMHKDLTSEHGFSPSWLKYIVPSMSPGKDLDDICRKSIEVFLGDMENMRGLKNVKVGFYRWSKQIVVKATSEAVWGPQNPYRDPQVIEAWETFSARFLTLQMFPFPQYIFPRLLHAREIVADAMIKYILNGGHKTASGLVRKRFEHHHDMFGLGLEDIGRGELGNSFAVLGNAPSCAVWVLYHIFSDEQVLADIRNELSPLVREQVDDEGVITKFVDLTSIRTSCPVLLSTFQETLRFRSINPGPRMVLEDVILDGGIFLKKGSMLMMPAAVQHSDMSVWGDDALKFDHLRFARKPAPGQKKPNRVAFRAFGGGHVLCPGRHFASIVIMALAASLALQFDVVPVAGKWAEPTWKNSPMTAGFPVPDEDIEVEFRPRESSKKRTVTFSDSGDRVAIVSEDLVGKE